MDKALDVSLYLEYAFSPLWPLILDIVSVFTIKKLKGTVTQICLLQCNPFNKYEKYFLLHLKSSLRSQDI